jgi:hypothetical protein
LIWFHAPIQESDLVPIAIEDVVETILTAMQREGRGEIGLHLILVHPQIFAQALTRTRLIGGGAAEMAYANQL